MKRPSPAIRRGGAQRQARAIERLLARELQTPQDRARSHTDATTSVDVGRVDAGGDWQPRALWGTSRWGDSW